MVNKKIKLLARCFSLGEVTVAAFYPVGFVSFHYVKNERHNGCMFSWK